MHFRMNHVEQGYAHAFKQQSKWIMSWWVKFIQCAWHLLRLFDLVRRPRGLHGSRLLSAGNLSHHLPVRGLPRPPGHHPGDTAVLHSKQTTNFLRTSALPGGQGQHPRHPRCQSLWWKVSHLKHVCLFCPFFTAAVSYNIIYFKVSSVKNSEVHFN